MTNRVHRKENHHEQKATDVLFDVGLKHRREVLGAEYVDKSIESANDFMMAFRHITTEWCWGYGWSREDLPRKTRSLLNLAMLTALMGKVSAAPAK